MVSYINGNDSNTTIGMFQVSMATNDSCKREYYPYLSNSCYLARTVSRWQSSPANLNFLLTYYARKTADSIVVW